MIGIIEIFRLSTLLFILVKSYSFIKLKKIRPNRVCYRNSYVPLDYSKNIRFLPIQDIDGLNKQVRILDMNSPDSSINNYPIVLLTGTAQTLDSYFPHFKYFSSYSRLIILELRGQGKTELASECATMDQHLHDMKAIFDLLNLDKFHIIGFSFGGRVGLAYASNYPNSVIKLSISCVPLVRSALGQNILESWKESLLVGNLREAAWSIVINSYSDRFHDKIGTRISNIINIIVDTNEPKKLYDLIHLSNISDENDPLSISNCIKRVNCPVQVIAAKRDRIACFDSVFNLYSCIKEKVKYPVFFECQNSGHSVPFEDPVIWQTNIIEFFKTDS